MEKRLLNINEACQYIGISPRKARQWLQDIGARRNIGRAVRYDILAIDRAIQEGVKNEEDFTSAGNQHDSLCVYQLQAEG